MMMMSDLSLCHSYEASDKIYEVRLKNGPTCKWKTVEFQRQNASKIV